jgi:hypothetical protein
MVTIKYKKEKVGKPEEDKAAGNSFDKRTQNKLPRANDKIWAY